MHHYSCGQQKNGVRWRTFDQYASSENVFVTLTFESMTLKPKQFVVRLKEALV